jgi:regulator of PEP synthase PpsR (kinase-PPPase family)
MQSGGFEKEPAGGIRLAAASGVPEGRTAPAAANLAREPHMMQPESRSVHVFIASDATGITAERVISAALVQFKQIRPTYRRFPQIQTVEQVDALLSEAEGCGAIVIYSIVLRDLREYIRRAVRARGIYAIDLLGPILRRIAKLWNLIPAFRPGLFKGISDESLRLAESIDFTLKHDDGLNLESAGEADLIILGVSRTSKTPTSLYLACNHNLKVANYPIVAEQALPEAIAGRKVRKFGFTISPEKLAVIRRKRLLYAGPTPYADIEEIRREVLYSHRIFRRLKNIQIVDVTNCSIEETAERIVAGL